MSQLAALKPTTPLATGSEWWALSIHTPVAELSDAVIAEIITPLASQARVWGAQRWFHTRCPDPADPFVHVRILASGRVLERLRSLLRALMDQASEGLRDLQITDHVEEPLPTRWDPGPVSPRAEAELAKYGGAEGLALAEEVFEMSSDLATWATARFPKNNSRSSLAALLLFDATHSMMKGPRSPVWADRRALSWDYYWDSHLRSCTASSGSQAAHVRQALTAQLAPRIIPAHRLMAATASEPAVDNWRKRWSRAIDTYLYRADKARVSRSAQHLTVYQSRLMLNRLGISVRDEAGLGLYARSWSKDREADFLNAGG